MTAAGLFAHLKDGSTHVCQCWAITRTDGVTFGFTDHDRPLSFDGITFLADSGMTARALALSSGLAVDNSEAMGLLQSDVIAEDDIVAGRFDGAGVQNWLVRWDDVTQRQLRFRGQIGEITRQAGQFQVELRGLTDVLNQPTGRTFLRTCSAVLGDARCKFDVQDPSYAITLPVLAQTARREVIFAGAGFSDRWFEQGHFEVTSGAAAGIIAGIKEDRTLNGKRQIVLWQALRAELQPGDSVRLVAGCDRRAETCRLKFGNLVNFRGFPDMPTDDWMTAVPRNDGASDGGSLRR